MKRLARQQTFRQVQQFQSLAVVYGYTAIRFDFAKPLVHVVQGDLQQLGIVGQLLTGLLKLGVQTAPLGDVAPHSSITPKHTSIVKDGGSADGYPVQPAFGVTSADFKVAKFPAGVQIVPMSLPVGVCQIQRLNFPPRQANKGVLRQPNQRHKIAIEPQKTVLRVLFPVPVRRQLRQTAKSRFARHQGRLNPHMLGDVGKGPDQTTIRQAPCLHFQCFPAGRGSQVTIRPVEDRLTHHIVSGMALHQLEVRAKITSVKLELEELVSSKPVDKQ